MVGTDRVFRGDCSTKQVYKEGAKEIALSVVNGINCKYGYWHLGICSLLINFISSKKFSNNFLPSVPQLAFLLMDKLAVGRHTQ